MIVKNLTCDFLISKIKKHKKYKSVLLDLIDKMPKQKSKQSSNSDWFIDKDCHREYLSFFYENVIRETMEEQTKHFKAHTWNITNGWFQQYYDNSFHDFHNHAFSNWANIYFLELPEPKDATKIKVKNKIFKYSVKEGDLITFPAHLLHMAPAISNNRKTVIAFNSNFCYI